MPSTTMPLARISANSVAQLATNSGATALTALMIGLTRAFIIYIQPEFEVLVPYLLMVLVLLVRPFGLFGAVQVRKI